GRDDDVGHQRVAAGGDQLAAVGEGEGPVAGVGERAIGHLDLEEALALDGDVERPTGDLGTTLPVYAGDGREPDPVPDLHRADDPLRRGRARSLHGLVEEVLEVRATPLEPGGVHVREVV